MTATTIKKPAKAPASTAAAVPMTLAQAKDAAFTELSQAVDLISSARSAAENGHYLERTLRMAEEIAIEVLGDMDHGRHDRHGWSDRMFDCQSLLMCAAAYNECAASTLAAQHAAKHLDHATDVLDQSFPDETPKGLATVEQPVCIKALLRGMVEHFGIARRQDLSFTATGDEGRVTSNWSVWHNSRGYCGDTHRIGERMFKEVEALASVDEQEAFDAIVFAITAPTWDRTETGSGWGIEAGFSRRLAELAIVGARAVRTGAKV
ncbi:MAG: hypothetical protein DI587_18465 [Variovorax paradoxus]|nr:MAG: hypothetical protein DI583_18465 [Variovorax paradoxus]PZQ08450.1 MAG: hypothetical protein DI587_18465 [Variovorax paradoxus]